MKSLRLTLCAMPLLLAGCSTLSSVNWSAANPWNWFGSSTQVTEQGVGALTGATPLDEKAIADALDGDYRLRSGMKTDNGNVVRFYEAMKDDKLAIVINGSQGTISRIDVLDHDISSVAGVEIGTPFSDLRNETVITTSERDKHRLTLLGGESDFHHGAIARNHGGGGVFHFDVCLDGAEIQPDGILGIRRKTGGNCISGTVNLTIPIGGGRAICTLRFNKGYGALCVDITR